MTALRAGLPSLPDRLASVPINEDGYPVPWFVSWVKGSPDFRCMDTSKLLRAVREKRCWTCGELLGAQKVFLIGPMCTVNLATAEPPSHLGCAEFAVKACPFLTEPKRKRRALGMPEDGIEVGEMIKRNPGVTCLWSTRTYEPFRVDNGVMFRIGDPTRVAWWARGRAATREEVLASMESGMPILRKAASDGGPDDSALLESMYGDALRHVPR